MCRGKNIPSGCVLSDYWNLASDYCPPHAPTFESQKNLDIGMGIRLWTVVQRELTTSRSREANSMKAP